MAKVVQADVAGLIPLDDLSSAERNKIQRVATATARKVAADINGVVESEICVRHMVFGDTTAATDWVDLDTRTAAVAGLEHWGEDAGDLTAGDLAASPVTLAGEKVDDNKCFVFYGFKDYGAEKDLCAIGFDKGSDTIAFWETEHCYGKEDGGMAPEILVYEQNDPITVNMNFRGGALDKNIVLLAYVGEKYGDHVTKP